MGEIMELVGPQGRHGAPIGGKHKKPFFRIRWMSAGVAPCRPGRAYDH